MRAQPAFRSIAGALLVLLACAVLARSALGAETIEVFVREGCPHCEKAEVFLAQLARERPDLAIAVRDVQKDPAALARLQELARARGAAPRVPTFVVREQVLVGYSEGATDALIRRMLIAPAPDAAADTGRCAADTGADCRAPAPAGPETLGFTFLGHRVTLGEVGLPAFTLAIGLLDGFNPCSMWVLLLMISLLAPLNDRPRMLAIAGTFVLVQGIAYFLFMTAWLNLFVLVGLSRASQWIVAAIAIVAGAINLKDSVAFGRGISLSIPERAKPGIYARMRDVLRARNLPAALIGTIVLAGLVQVVEFMCTSGFPALYTRILTLRELDRASYYGYLLLYNAAYMLDDMVVLGIGVVMLTRHRLQEREGRWLKLASGLVMIGLGVYLVLDPAALAAH